MKGSSWTSIETTQVYNVSLHFHPPSLFVGVIKLYSMDDMYNPHVLIINVKSKPHQITNNTPSNCKPIGRPHYVIIIYMPFQLTTPCIHMTNYPSTHKTSYFSWCGSYKCLEVEGPMRHTTCMYSIKSNAKAHPTSFLRKGSHDRISARAHDQQPSDNPT